MKIEDLDVFKLSHELTLQVYKVDERFGLTSQMRRSAASIPTNLMEGGHRVSKNEYRHFVSISRGSCGEIKYQLFLPKNYDILKKFLFAFYFLE